MFYQRIRYFLKAAESGSFSKAADQMFISAQALTKQIGLLEDELGGELFVRSHKGITLTPLGEYAQLKFKKIDQELNGTVEELRRQAGNQKERINIGIFSALPQEELVSPVISFLLSNYHEYQISLEIVEFRDGRELLLAGKIDLLLTYIHEEEKWQDYNCQCFEEHDAKVVVSLLHPWAIYDNIEVKNMESETFLKLRTGNENYLPEPGERFYDKIPCKNIQEVNNFGTLLALLQQGKGFAVFPKVFANAERSRIKCFDYPGKPLRHYAALVYRQEHIMPWINRIAEDIKSEFNLKSSNMFH